MAKFYKRRKQHAGLPPGTITTTDDQNAPCTITIIDYNAEKVQDKEVLCVDDTFPYKNSPTVTWINIECPDPGSIQKVNEHYGIHPLVSEDIVNLGQRPKVEDYGQYLFLVMKMIYVKETKNEIIDEQISMILGPGFVISYQEKKGDVFDPIRTRIKECKGRIRSMGADYLAYALMDAIVDNYFSVLDKRADEIDRMEEEIMTHPDQFISQRIHTLKRDMIHLRKHIGPVREMILNLQRNESPLIQKKISIYLRDVYDHTIQLLDTVDTFKDLLSGIHDSYLSAMSNKMNEVMKTLTIFAAIFIPLTFIAGIYGMNFEYMPELQWKYGYFIILAVMLSLGVGLSVYFKQKKWF
jgi:magnesium transporter